MSIEFTLWSVPATAYQAAVNSGRLSGEHTAECRRIAEDWDLLTRVLAAGDPAAPAASAITGGHILENDELDHGGTRIFSPYEVALLAAALDAVDEAEFDRRYQNADFSGAYRPGSDDNEDEDQPAPPPDQAELLKAFSHLQTSYNEAAMRGDAVAVWLS
ncbi:MAG: DUF1877 family protein [Catenulispora sp.]|nr:DUF1877 family protein [Catenulispora sp.]